MANYTIELRTLLDRGYHLNLDHYPIFSEEYRPVLNRKIINHFYFREIGQETPDRFNFMLARKLDEIMPYYNKLYMSEMISFDPLATEYFTSVTEDKRSQDTTRNTKDRKRGAETTGDVYTSNLDRHTSTNYIEHNDENQDATYTKYGDKTIDYTRDQTEDLNEKTTSHNTRTDNLQENTTEKITTNTLTTNDLTSNTVTDSTGSGTSDTRGTKNTTFSDIPQAGITTTVTVNPDGSVTTETTGYATTTTNENTTEHNTSTTEAHSDSTTTNTGTVNVDGTSDRTTNTSNTGTQDNDGNGTKDNDNTIEIVDNTVENWREAGTSNQKTDYNETNDTVTAENIKEDSERNIARNEKVDTTRKELEQALESAKSDYTEKGRKGWSPAELIQKYRDILLNIDMQIIDDLETLFMGVY